MNTVGLRLSSLRQTVRWALLGSVSVGAIGAIAGLIIGLRAYAPTAPFAVVEVGLPAAVAGGVVGLAAAVIVRALRRS